MKTGPSKYIGVLLLASLSAASLSAARVESCTSLSWMLATSTCFIGFPWLVWLGLKTRFAESLDRFFPLICIVWTSLPFIAEAISRKFGIGDAPEIAALVCFQNAALILAAYSHRPRCRHIACLFAAFLTLYAIVIRATLMVCVLAGLFGVMMLWWLMAKYWERVQQTVIEGQINRGLPLRSAVMGGVLLISAILLLALGSTSASTYVMRGFMPSSGGDRWTDIFARAGTGDGDALIAATEDAMSFGPVDSEIFLDAEMPTLYDMLNDMYGEPLDPKKQERAVAIDSGEIKEAEQRVAKTERGGREFSALRRHVERTRKALDDRNAAAMFYIVGRTPLHLALERFDTFDGQQWTHSGQRDPHPPIRMEDDRGKLWAYCSPLEGSPLYRGLEPHAVKFINLKTNRFPSSPQLAAVHVHKVNRPDFYGWTTDSVMCMPLRKQIPQLTVAQLRSQTLNLESLRSEDFTADFSHADQLEQQGNNSADVFAAERLNELTKSEPHADLVSQTADAWTKEVPRGWKQVEAVVNHLRQDFTLDRQATTDANCTDVVSRFLTERRGPDYLFATTAAILLRNLDYPTRLVTGFYARSDRFDRRAGQTTVLAEDVHVWAEVYVGDNTWVAIEPTPGYEPPTESLTIGQWASTLALSFFTWCQRHIFLLLMITTGLLVSFKTRRYWLAFFGSLLCRLMGMRSAEARIRWTLRLLAWRAWLAGCPRPAERTISSWYAPLLRDRDTKTKSAVEHFFLWSERLLYSSWNIHSADGPDIANACTAATIVSRPQAMHHYLKETPSHLP